MNSKSQVYRLLICHGPNFFAAVIAPRVVKSCARVTARQQTTSRDLATPEGKLASGWLGPRDVFRVYDWPGEEGIHQSFGNARPTSAAFLLQSPMVRDTGA